MYFNPNLLILSFKCFSFFSGRFRGGSGGSLEPPRPNYFYFMCKFMKNQVK